MLKIEFKNACVEDHGFGLRVNGKELEAIISTALGTKVDARIGVGSGLPEFKSTCCNVTIVIDPQPVTEQIETDDEIWYSVEDLKECKREQYAEKAKAAKS